MCSATGAEVTCGDLARCGHVFAHRWNLHDILLRELDCNFPIARSKQTSTLLARLEAVDQRLRQSLLRLQLSSVVACLGDQHVDVIGMGNPYCASLNMHVKLRLAEYARQAAPRIVHVAAPRAATQKQMIENRRSLISLCYACAL